MPKSPTEIRSLARAHTETALNTLVGIMRQPDASPTARIAAVGMLLEYGWGKPRPASIDEDNQPEKVDEVIRTLVDPSKPPGQQVSNLPWRADQQTSSLRGA